MSHGIAPEQGKRHFPEEAPVAWDPIRRDLEENEDWYRDVVEHSQDRCASTTLKVDSLSINPVPARLLGYSVEEMLHKPMRDLVDPQFRDQFDVYLREIERTGESRGLLAVVTRSGEQRIWEYHNTLRTEGVETPIVRGIAHDVTERVRAEKALRASNEQLLKTAREREQTLHDLTLFRTLLDQSNDAIHVVDPKTLRFLDVNEKACSELGYSREELLSMTVHDIDPNSDESWVERVRHQLLEAGFAIMETAHRRKDGTTFPVEVNLRRVQLEREYVVSISRDITERKRAEEALRTSEREQHKIAEQLETERARLIEAQAVAKVGSWETELPSLDITWSEQTHRIFETDPSNFHPRRPGFVELVHPEDRAKVDAAFEASLEKGAPSTVEYRIVMADGRVKVLEEHWKVFQDGQGRPARLVGTCQDITERKRTEEALRESEERFRVALKHSPISVFNQDRDLRYTWMYNPQVPRPVSEQLGKTAHEIFDPEAAARITEVRRRVLETGVGARDEIQVTFGGRKRYLSNTIEPLLDSAGAVIGLTGSSMDVTELRETTEALREAKKKLTEEKLYLEQEINTELGFAEIIGGAAEQGLGSRHGEGEESGGQQRHRAAAG